MEWGGEDTTPCNRQLDMAVKTGSLLGPFGRSAALLGVRWLQPGLWLGLPDACGLNAPQQARGKARGNEYRPSNVKHKRKHKHGWVQRCTLKSRKSLTH
jgi:large subunit ribosomal protein L34